MEEPGIAGKPPTTTLVGSPAVWESTAQTQRPNDKANTPRQIRPFWRRF